MVGNLFQSYAPGSVLAGGEVIQAVCAVRPVPARPDLLGDDALGHLARLPPTPDQRLIATTRYLVYHTDYALLDLLKDLWTEGAWRYAPGELSDFIDYMSDMVDTRDRSLWFDRSRIHGADLDVHWRSFSGLFGERSLPFFYYGIFVAPDFPLYYVQIPVSASRRSEQTFGAMYRAVFG